MIRRRLAGAKADQEVHNPRQKDTFVFKRTARETGGELLELDVFASPEAVPPRSTSIPAKRSASRFSLAPSALAWAARSVP